MNAKRFASLSISLTLVLLILVAALQIAIDPLFQYHQPWFGLNPVVKDERYQNAGIAKTFDYENAIIGNSLSENFYVSDVEKIFGGKTVKLTAAGSNPIDWAKFLNILSNRKQKIKTVLLELDPYRLQASISTSKAELPQYLFDSNYFNDVNYLLNFSILSQYTITTLKKNRNGKISKFDDAFVWDHGDKGSKETVLNAYSRPEKTVSDINDTDIIEKTRNNLDLVSTYFSSMPDTKFVFFFAPFSILFWDACNQQGNLESNKIAYLTAVETLLEYENVEVYFWSDEEMIGIMENMDNYTDMEHYNKGVNKMMLNRISQRVGLLSKENYQHEINSFWTYLKKYNYDELFE